MPARRFPPPWSAEDIGAAFVVRDHNGQQLAYCLFWVVAQFENASMIEPCGVGRQERGIAKCARLPPTGSASLSSLLY
jgi:hypothetical protein